MADTPTIVVAHLDDEKLKSSIQSLVTNINAAMDSIKAKTTSTVADMQRSLQTLGNIKVSSGGSADGGASRRKKAQEEETQAIKQTIATRKELKMTLDQQASAMQPKSARDSYYAFFQGYKAQAQQLGQQIQQFETALNQAVTKRVGEIEKQINATKSRIQELNNEMNRSYATNNMSVAAQKQREMQTEVRKLTELQQRLNNVGNEFSTSKIALASMYTEHHRLSNIMKEEVTAAQQVKQETQQQVSVQQQATTSTQAQAHAARDAAQAEKERADRIREYASEARNAMAQSGLSAYQMHSMRTNAMIYAENDARAKGLTIEQQIEQILKQEADSFNRATQSANNLLDAERKITQEYEKRKTYKTPYTGIDESFRKMVGRTIGVGAGEINSTSTKISTMTVYLKQLEQAYKNLTDQERRSPFGKQLREEIQMTSRTLKDFQSQMMRPISLQSVWSLPTRTLDEIREKMRQLASYRSGLNVETQRNEINQVNAKYAELQKRMDDVMQKNSQMIASNTALGRSWNYMKNRLAFYFSVGASTAFVKNLIEVRSQYEMNERALGILINSAERGTQIFNELSQMALVSPYTLIELSTAAKQLTAYDVAAKDVVDTTRRLADMASAVGIPIERLTYALGQIKAYGYLNSRDARMFSNAGIPLVKQLSEYYSELEGKLVSTADIYDRIKKKAIGYNDVMQVVNKMTDEGGKFFDFQAKMADTLKVRLANLTLAWNNMLNDIGKESQGMLTGGINLLKEFFLHWKELNRAIEDIAIALGVAKAAHLLYYGVVMGTNKAIAIETVLGTRLSNILRSLGTTMSTVLTSATTWWALLAVAVGAAIAEVFRGNEAMKEFNKTLRENAENTYNDLSKFAQQYKEVRDSLYKTDKGVTTPVDIDKNEAQKAWEAVREQIELSSHASDEYISKIIAIDNVSERLRQGFNLLDNIQEVSAAIKELSDDAIKLERDWSAWWNLGLLPDGTIGNLKNAHMWLGKINDEFGSIEQAAKLADSNNIFSVRASEYIKNYQKELEQFKKDLETTTQSVLNFINLKGWSGDTTKIDEVFKQITDNLIQKNQLDADKAYTLQVEMENARSQAAKEALEKRINDERAALKIAYDKELAEALNRDILEYKNWNESNGRKKVEWERFTKWMKEQHIHETTAMFRGMDDEQIKSLNFQDGEYNKFVTRMVDKYAREHKMSYDDAFNYLKRWVLDANQWSIFIKLNIGTEDDKSIYDILSEADSAADTAFKKMERLRRRQKELQAKGGSLSADQDVVKEYKKVTEEITSAQQDYNDALEKGGHSQKEEKAAAKSRREAAKAQREAETELQKALKDELQLIDKVRSQYEKLSKAGVDSNTALTMVTNQFDKSIAHINQILGKNGLPLFDIKTFAGTDNPNAILKMLNAQLEAAKGAKNIKPSEIKDLEVKVGEIKVDAKTYDYKKITDGLNNELGRLKDEYELAVALDAEPELGSLFADMWGVNMETLPKDAEEYARRYTRELNRYLKEMGSDLEIPSLLNITKDDMRAFEQQSAGGVLNKEWYEEIQKGYKATHDAREKEFKEQAKEWDRLLQKYAEYEYKKQELRKQYERDMDIALKKGAGKDITDAITNRFERESARLDFEEYQKTADWIVATGDLSGMTDRAIGGLIKSLEEYKKKAKNLDPKQIRQINNALKNLYKQQRSGNPFKAIANAMQEAKSRASEYDEAIDKTEQEVIRLNAAQDSGIELTEEQKEKLQELEEELKRLRQQQEAAGEVDASTIVGGINDAIAVARQATSAFADMANAIGGKGMTDAAKTIQDVVGIVEKAGAGAAAGAQIGQGYGAIIGAVVGAAAGIITTYADRWSGNAAITDSVEDSVRSVKRLENAYKELEDAIDHAYGTAIFGAKRTAIANKELQLVELKRQLQLEYSRKSKNRDKDKIEDLKSQIIDLELEIKNAAEEVVNELLGISSVGDAMESLMDGFVEALRGGENAMETFNESIDEMIANMVKKMFTTKILQPWFDEQWDVIQSELRKRAGEIPDELAKIQSSITNASLVDINDENSLVDALRALGLSDEEIYKIQNFNEQGKLTGEGRVERLLATYEKVFAEAQDKQEQLTKELANVTTPTTNDIRRYAELLRSGQPVMEENMQEVADFLRELGLMKDSSSKELSALQQGIQGITEDTAGAIEAYMNGISQQVYFHSSILEQIRDAVVGFDLDVQVATMGQILLQLQASYQVQGAIQSILEGWSNPNGQSVRVELVS